MKKWSFLVAAAIATALLAAGCAAKAQELPPEPERPNLVFLLYDDARYSDVIHQQGTQELAAEGTLFRDFYITDPQCCPSRSTFLTGMYGHNTGILKNDCTPGPADGCWRKFKGEHTDVWLPKRLQDAGYKTGIFGKLMNGCELGCRPPNFNAIHLTSNERPHRSDHGVANRAAEFFRENPGTPKAVFLWMRCPHVPCKPASHAGEADSLARDDLDASYAEADVSEKLGAFGRLNRPGEGGMEEAWQDHIEMTMHADDGLQLMRQTARELGEYENTVWAISSDNGWNLGEHRAVNGKTLPYTASTRVPLVMAGPGVPHAVRDDLAANHDFVPTVAALLGLPPLAGYTEDGQDLFGPLSREVVLIEHSDPNLIYGRGKIDLPAYKAARYDDGDLYIEWANGHKEYYDEPTHTEPSPPPPGISERLRGLVTCSGLACQTAEN